MRPIRSTATPAIALTLAGTLLGFAEAAAQRPIHVVFSVDSPTTALAESQIPRGSVDTVQIAAAMANSAQVAFPYQAWSHVSASADEAALRVTLRSGEGEDLARWWLVYEAKLGATWDTVRAPGRCSPVWEAVNIPPPTSDPRFADALTTFFVRALKGDSTSATTGARLDCTAGNQRFRAIEEELVSKIAVAEIRVGGDRTIDFFGHLDTNFRQTSILTFEVDQNQAPIGIRMTRVGTSGFVKVSENCSLGEVWTRVIDQAPRFPLQRANLEFPFDPGATVRAFVWRYDRPYLTDGEDQLSGCLGRAAGAGGTRP